MALGRWLVCLFWVCEQSLDITTPGPTEGIYSTVSLTDLPEPAQGCDLSGFWYNELGSEVYLKVASGGLIRGEYRTAVEFSYGAAGDGPSTVLGTSDEEGDTFGFTVLWRGHNTTSVTSWVGVCDICDGQTTLKTSWVLQYKEDDCGERNKWTGENTFTRHEQKPGPRRAHSTNNPRDFQRWYRYAERNWKV